MRMKKILFYLLAAVLGGCVLPSLHPLYSDKDIVFEEKLLGNWRSCSSKEMWLFEKGSEPNSYNLTGTDTDGSGKFIAHLVAIDDMLFLDLFPGEPESLKSCSLWRYSICPLHLFIKVDQIEPTLKIRMMNPEKMQKLLENDPNLLKHEILEKNDNRIVLTASTAELQKFMRAYGNSDELFGDVAEFKPPAAVDPNSPDNEDPDIADPDDTAAGADCSAAESADKK